VTPAILRSFEPGDLRRVLAIERESFGVDAWPPDLFRDYAADGRCWFTVAESGRVLAGYCIDSRRREGWEIESIAVRPRNRGQGVASLLLRDVIRRAQHSEARHLALMVRRDNAGAIALYRKFGFVRVATVGGYYEDGATAWRMRLPLAAEGKMVVSKQPFS
jgi:[ribosomal protein S18]-alanine N-acetyltransferase